MKEYFSEEILELLGEAIVEKQIDTLLAWLRDTRMNLVVRKVAASALGFVTGETTAQIVCRHLRKLFEMQDDICVDGRIAESLWRLGDKTAHLRFIERLDSYPDRERKSGDIWMQLTFELDLPQKVAYDEETSRRLTSLVLKSANPVVRKHALILLFRSSIPLAASTITKYCLNEALALSDAVRAAGSSSNDSGIAAFAALIRSLLYGTGPVRHKRRNVSNRCHL
jgi:HEAT repeat protein